MKFNSILKVLFVLLFVLAINIVAMPIAGHFGIISNYATVLNVIAVCAVLVLITGVLLVVRILNNSFVIRTMDKISTKTLNRDALVIKGIDGKFYFMTHGTYDNVYVMDTEGYVAMPYDALQSAIGTGSVVGCTPEEVDVNNINLICCWPDSKKIHGMDVVYPTYHGEVIPVNIGKRIYIVKN
jgi:hypothetical protein